MIDFSNLEKYRENNRIEAKRALAALPKSIWEPTPPLPTPWAASFCLESWKERINPCIRWICRTPEAAHRGISRPPEPARKSQREYSFRSEYLRRDRRRLPHHRHHGSPGRPAGPPVYIDGNPFTGTYLRNGEGDYRCTKEEVQAMLREAARKSPDMDVLEQTEPQALDPDSIHRYASRMILRLLNISGRSLKPRIFSTNLELWERDGTGSSIRLPPDSSCSDMNMKSSGNFRPISGLPDMTVSESGQKKYHQVRRIVSSSGDWSETC